MLISHSHKFIYIHNYKAGGTSIKRAFKTYNAPDFRGLPHKQKLLHLTAIRPWFFSNHFHSHIKAKELKEQLPNKIFNNYFKFSIVRNPWSWVLSHYTYALQQPRHHQHELFKSMGNFETYLKWRINEEYICQKDFLYDSYGHRLVDYVGKLETLQEDLTRICEYLNTPYIEAPHHNISNKDKGLHHYYTDKTLNMVAETWKEDIDAFNYEIPNI